MRWVERDGDGAIVGTYANRQTGIAEEAMADDDAEILAYENPAPPLAERTAAECTRRIYAVVDQYAQINLAAAAGAGLLNEAQAATYRAGVLWVAAMRVAYASIVEDGLDPADDANWPQPSAEIVALAAAF